MTTRKANVKGSFTPQPDGYVDVVVPSLIETENPPWLFAEIGNVQTKFIDPQTYQERLQAAGFVRPPPTQTPSSTQGFNTGFNNSFNNPFGNRTQMGSSTQSFSSGTTGFNPSNLFTPTPSKLNPSQTLLTKFSGFLASLQFQQWKTAVNQFYNIESDSRDIFGQPLDEFVLSARRFTKCKTLLTQTTKLLDALREMNRETTSTTSASARYPGSNWKQDVATRQPSWINQMDDIPQDIRNLQEYQEALQSVVVAMERTYRSNAARYIDEFRKTKGTTACSEWWLGRWWSSVSSEICGAPSKYNAVAIMDIAFFCLCPGGDWFENDLLLREKILAVFHVVIIGQIFHERPDWNSSNAEEWCDQVEQWYYTWRKWMTTNNLKPSESAFGLKVQKDILDNVSNEEYLESALETWVGRQDRLPSDADWNNIAIALLLTELMRFLQVSFPLIGQSSGFWSLLVSKMPTFPKWLRPKETSVPVRQVTGITTQSPSSTMRPISSSSLTGSPPKKTQYSIRVLSVNVRYWSSAGGQDPKFFEKLVNSEQVDIVCLQEDTIEVSPFTKPFEGWFGSPWYKVQCNTQQTIQDGGKTLTLANTMYLKLISSTFDSFKMDITESCPTNRCANFVKTNDGLKLANVHLCGGKFDDQKIQNSMNSKEEALRSIVNEWDPNVIVGDFNGQPIDEQARRILSKYDPYSRAANKSQFEKYWSGGHDFLTRNGYLPFTNNIEQTSKYGGMPDWVYVKGVNVSQYWILDTLAWTDHNAILIDLEY